MPLPPSIKALMPSLSIDETSNITTLSLDDFKRFMAFVLENVVVDEDWDIACYSDVRDAVQKLGAKRYATEHYRTHGFLEGRLPHDPIVDEEWYRQFYPDVDDAIRIGKEADAKSHFVEQGYREGREPVPSTSSSAVSTPRTAASVRRNAVPRPAPRAPLSRAEIPRSSS